MSTGTLGITSTGTAAANAAGGLVEALTAGTPLLHLTGQIESGYPDRGMAYVHEAPDQLTMLAGKCWRLTCSPWAHSRRRLPGRR